jgi:hypothetical protein
MRLRQLLIAILVFIMGDEFAPGIAQTNKIDWKVLDSGKLWVALHQTYGGIRFSAVKFHLGYYKLNLVDVSSYKDRYLKRLRAISDERKFSNSLLDVGIKAIFETWPDHPDNLVTVAPAGWSTSVRRIEHSGLLRISGEELSEFDDRPSLSALICLHSPDQRYQN